MMKLADNRRLEFLMWLAVGGAILLRFVSLTAGDIILMIASGLLIALYGIKAAANYPSDKIIYSSLLHRIYFVSLMVLLAGFIMKLQRWLGYEFMLDTGFASLMMCIIVFSVYLFQRRRKAKQQTESRSYLEESHDVVMPKLIRGIAVIGMALVISPQLIPEQYRKYAIEEQNERFTQLAIDLRHAVNRLRGERKLITEMAADNPSIRGLQLWRRKFEAVYDYTDSIRQELDNIERRLYEDFNALDDDDSLIIARAVKPGYSVDVPNLVNSHTDSCRRLLMFYNGEHLIGSPLSYEIDESDIQWTDNHVTDRPAVAVACEFLILNKQITDNLRAVTLRLKEMYNQPMYNIP